MKKPLKFTPLEFETEVYSKNVCKFIRLKFTPLEFETELFRGDVSTVASGLKFTPLEFETL